MKKQLLVLLAFMALQTTIVHAQFKFGVRGGISTTEIEPDQIVIGSKDDAEAFGLAVEEANYSFHGGIFFRIGNKFFVQPEVLFNTSKVTFRLEDFGNISTYDGLREETYNYLDIPFMMGWKLGPLRFQAGPVGHVFLDSEADFSDLEDYDPEFSKFTMGWQAGLGLDIWKIILDFKYEGSFQKFGDHLVFNGEDYQFDENPGRFVASVGLFF